MCRNRHWLAAALVIAAACAWGCGEVINNPTPHITSLSPPNTTAGQPAMTLTANGSGFAPSSVIQWGNVTLATTVLSSTQATALVPVSFLTSAGTFGVDVATPAPGGGTTAVLLFTVNSAPSQVPHISSISPVSAIAGTSQLVVQISGTNFTPQSVAAINGNNRQTGFTSTTTLSATLTASDLALAANLPIEVINPPATTTPPGGGISNTANLTVLNPLPGATSITPTSAAAGGSSLVITVTGTALNSSSQVTFNGNPRATTLLSGTQVATTLTQADLAQAGIALIGVRNPSPGGGASNALLFSLDANSTGTATGLPEFVDFAFNGLQADNGIGNVDASGPVLGGLVNTNNQGNGRYVVFASISNNLVANDTNGAADIFLRDTCLDGNTAGQTGNCMAQTTLISVSSDGAQANAPSQEPGVDSAGTHFVFTSKATNLDPNFTFTGTTNQLFLHTKCTTPGCTRLVSASSDGTSPASSDVSQPSISPDGRYVAFVSLAANLVAGLTPAARQVFLRDTCLAGTIGGCVPTTILVSTPDSANDNMNPAGADATNPIVGSNGQFIAFVSAAANLPSGNGATSQIYVRNTCLGVASGCTPGTALASTPGGATAANGASLEPAMTQDGRFVAFASTATNLVAAASTGVQQIFVRDTCTGVSSGCTASTSLISVDGSGNPGGIASEFPSISGTGQIVAFEARAATLATVTPDIKNIFARNTCVNISSGTTCTPSTILASTAASGAASNGDSIHPALSADGHTVSFLSFASNIVSPDTNNSEDIFLASTTF